MTDKPSTNKNKKPQLQLIKPKTINQSKIFKEFNKGKHLFIHGCAGTGKSFLATYLALQATLNENKYKEIVIIRSAVPSRKQGFLPGNDEEKNEVYELPYEAIVNELHSDSSQNVYKILKNEKRIRFLSTSYLRGLTLDNAIIIADEVQNYTWMEFNTVITRVGNNCRLIICGDTNQNDLLDTYEESCIEDIQKRLNLIESFSMVEMTVEDIQRSGLVREWIEACNNCNSKFWFSKNNI